MAATPSVIVKGKKFWNGADFGSVTAAKVYASAAAAKRDTAPLAVTGATIAAAPESAIKAARKREKQPAAA